MSLAAGEQLGPYKILGRLGAGGMGEVYRAHDSRLGREVAIKILPLSVAHDAAALARLEREARAIAALNHPNLLTIFDVGTLPAGSPAAGSPFLVSELLAGETLRAKLAGGALPVRKAMDYGAQIARGLAAAHAKGIIHRDLKPENLFCCDDGRVKVLDFGLAKVVEAASGEEVTQAAPGTAATAAGVVLGTMGYMAPEQARGRTADARSDIFSLGAVLYEMLSGRRAFGGESSADVLSAILREDPPELSASGRAIPPGLERIVRHCLEKEPAQRFESAGDIAFQLQELTLATSTTAGAAPAPGRGLSRRWRFALAGCAGLAAVAAIAWYTARATYHPPAWAFTHLTYRQGFISSARLLPDGQGYVGVGTWNNAAQPTLFTGRLGASGLQDLGHGAIEVLAVSSGGELAVLQRADGALNGVPYGPLARMPLSGGAARAVLDNVEAADWRTGDLARDAAIARFHPRARDTTVEYPVGHVLYTTPAGIGDLRLSPDGTRLAFLAHYIAGDDNGRVAVVETSNGAERDLTPDYESSMGLAWGPKGREVWFTASNGTENYLQAVDLAGRVRTLFRGVTDLMLGDTDSTGRALVISNDRRYLSKLVTPDHAGAIDISVLDAAAQCVLSADGKEVAVGDENAGSNYSTYLRAATPDAEPVRLGDGDPNGISPDGRWVVSSLPSAPRQLLLLPTGVGQQRQLTHGNVSFPAARALWMPDSESFVAVGVAPNQLPRSYRVDLQGRVTPVTPPGTRALALAPGGSALLTVSGIGSEVQFALSALHGGGTTPVAALHAGDVPLTFDGAGTVIVRRLGAPGSGIAAENYRVDLRTGTRTLVNTVPWPDGAGVAFGLFAYSVADGGKTVAFSYLRELSTLGMLEESGR